MVSFSLKDLCIQAAKKIGVVGQGSPMKAEMLSDFIFNANLILDSWNVNGGMMFNQSYHTFNIGNSQQVYTIGPGGDFDVDQRPIELVYASFQQSSTPPLDLPLTIVSTQEWASIQIKGISSALGSVIYMDESWPLGNVYIWPKPSVSAKLVLTLLDVLDSNGVANGTFSMPPAYARVLMLNLACNMAPNYGKPVPQDLLAIVAKLKGEIENANYEPQRIVYDVGMAGGTYNSADDQVGRGY